MTGPATGLATGLPSAALGAPGVYLAPDVVRAPPAGVRMDVCAFVGVAPRGPAWERLDDPALERGVLPGGRARSVAVPVQSWSEYEDLFGGHAGPGLLPAAVSAFFAQGGARAYVVRVVPRAPLPAPEPPARAAHVFGEAVATPAGPLRLHARNEGSWGDRLAASLTLTAATVPPPAVDGWTATLAPGVAWPVGTLLRLWGGDPAGSGPRSLHAVTAVGRRPARHGPGWERYATLDRPFAGEVTKSEVVTATLEVTERVGVRGRTEHFDGLGLLHDHPRWLGAILAESSRLVDLPYGVTEIRPDPALRSASTTLETPGVDRYESLTPDDVFGIEPPDSAAPPAGLDALRDLPDCASLCVPDLYAPLPPPDEEDVSVPETFAGAEFAACVAVAGSPAAGSPEAELAGLRLDPARADERARIVALQQRVVRAAERLGLVALLDVPPGLRPAQVRAWRAAFDSSHAAGYHGWPRVPRPNGTGLAPVPPSAYAAGVLAATELAFGLPRGPAQVTLTGAVDILDGPSAGGRTPEPATLGDLHRAGVNVAVQDRAGVKFTAARTLSGDPAWAQLTARRVVSQLERTLPTALSWATFEPNGATLREGVRVTVTFLLEGLLAAGAFAGATPAEAFFVRVPEAAGSGSGEADLLCEIGVAPSAPLEFLVVRVLRTDDGMLGVGAGG